jgi:cyclic-di-GMP phosphodiesterase TipF (flagellum assembly factor)
VVDLLDYDVRFGQGFLFSPPRPVRAEALQGVAGDDAKEGGKDSAFAGAQAPGDAGVAKSGFAQLARAGTRRT